MTTFALRHCLRRSALDRIFQKTVCLQPRGREPTLRPARLRMLGAVSGRRSVSEYSFLKQTEAQQLDADLMSPELGFSIDQLMELAGLSCASAIAAEYPASTHRDVVILAGPGNNGATGSSAPGTFITLATPSRSHIQSFGRRTGYMPGW